MDGWGMYISNSLDRCAKCLEKHNKLLEEQNAALNRIADALEKKPDKKLLLEEKE